MKGNRCKDLVWVVSLLLLPLLLSHCRYKSIHFLTELNGKRKSLYFKTPYKYKHRIAILNDSVKSIAVIYSDSSITYIAEGNSEVLPNFYQVQVSDSRLTSSERDTAIITHSGIFNHKAWKELIYKNQIRLGYHDVPTGRDSLFDKGLFKSIPRKDRKKKKSKK